MNQMWWGVITVVAGCYLLKLAGLSVPERLLEHPMMVRAAALIPVGLLGALVAVQTFAEGSHLVLDARIAALAVAAVLLALRVPFLPMLVAAGLTAAAIRAF